MFQWETFRKPEAKYGIHPFWFWNGDMEDSEIVRQIEEMASKQVGGFFICPRQGLKVPYLSDAWFEKVRLAAETAKRLGLEVWLYDEYPYPSGIAGGEVTLEHPEAKHQTLAHRTEPVAGGGTVELDLPWAKVLYAKAVPIDPATGRRRWPEAVDVSESIGNHQAEPIFQKAGLTAYNQKRFFTYRTMKKLIWTAPAGDNWEVHCFLEEELEDFKYYGTFVDPCHSEAMRTFIRLTHDRYARSVGDLFGATIKGMFTDEIGLLGAIPWSPQLPRFFRERNGYDIREALHALVCDDAEEKAKVRYDFFQAVHLLLRTTYHEQVYDWCEERGLQYAAEVPSVRMTTQRYSHVPGGDSGHEKLGRSLDWILNRYAYSFRYNPKMISSIGNQLNRERNLIECFHSVGWSMTLQDAKWMIDRLAAFGTNFFNFHAFFYTLDGITKHDAPPSQFYQNPYWRHFGMLGDYVKRISYVMSCGAPVRPVAVLDPTTTFWTRMGNPFHEFQYGGGSEAERAELERYKADWLAVCKALTLNQTDFDHLDPELLSEADVREGTAFIGRAAYRIVVLPPMANLERAAWEKLKAFLDAGGHVVAVGKLPHEDIEEGASVAREMAERFAAGGGAVLVQDERELLERLAELSLDAIRFESERRGSFLVQRRKLDDGLHAVFMTNQEDGVVEASVAWNAADIGDAAVRLCLETGKAEVVSAETSSPEPAVALTFAPYASHLLVIGPRDRIAEYEAAGDERRADPIALDAGGLWSVAAESPNALRLDAFELAVEPEGGANAGTVVQAKTFIDQCEDIAKEQRLPLAFHQIFGTPMKMHAAYPLPVRYTVRFDVETMPAGGCFLLKDRGAISGEHAIRINGRELPADAFEPTMLYDRANERADIRSYLQPGVNTLVVDVVVAHDWDGVTDALYICGDFGVFRSASSGLPAICDAPKQLPLSGGPLSGFPHFAGTLTFRKEIELDEPPASGTVTLRFREWDASFHDCAELFVNGVSFGARPWTPYEWSGEASAFRPGRNVIEVKVTTSLIGLLEGKRFRYDTHTLEPALP
ncbi:glycosyl hydrolase [Paenibacillus sp.]|uniref:glycosyl hydrolase n=1 Tax=Paenibacillus sp. TaxID=58172 RepID=UPI002D24377D|nr:glycosyl hydrolase [Paenibacillus sp.]HZG86647.1 glycosyl hydrolase [Paenibacillus sp.]